MIANALSFVANQLDGFLKRKTNTSESMVKMANQGLIDENALVISIVNLTEEGSIKNSPSFQRRSANLVKKAPPVYINVHILISASFSENQYEEGLHWLSLAINFFQSNPYFSSEKVSMPKNIDKLSFEIVNLDIDTMGQLWTAMGVSFRPSILYKMRMLEIGSENDEAILSEIKNPKR